MSTMASCLDAIKVHAAAAAIVAGGATFNDVAVRFPAARGRSISVFYAGERDSYFFGQGSLNSEHMAQAVMVRAMWPLPETAKKRAREIEIEIAAYALSFRGKIDGDFTLGNNCTALKMLPGPVETVLHAKTKYAVLDHLIGIDLDDIPHAP